MIGNEADIHEMTARRYDAEREGEKVSTTRRRRSCNHAKTQNHRETRGFVSSSPGKPTGVQRKNWKEKPQARAERKIKRSPTTLLEISRKSRVQALLMNFYYEMLHVTSSINWLINSLIFSYLMVFEGRNEIARLSNGRERESCRYLVYMYILFRFSVIFRFLFLFLVWFNHPSRYRVVTFARFVWCICNAGATAESWAGSTPEELISFVSFRAWALSVRSLFENEARSIVSGAGWFRRSEKEEERMRAGEERGRVTFKCD